jgi:hypothetical protein
VIAEGTRSAPRAALTGTPDEYLLAAKRRCVLQRAYATWVAEGARGYGRAFVELQWAADAHMQSQLSLGL